jgi:hypothetical protein
MTPNFVILISSGVSVVSISTGVWHLWPPPNLAAGLSLLLMSMMSVPAGFLLRAYVNVIVAIDQSRLSGKRKRRELDRVASSIFTVFDKMGGIAKRATGGGNHDRDR